jgi:hypothetical protein
MNANGHELIFFPRITLIKSSDPNYSRPVTSIRGFSLYGYGF